MGAICCHGNQNSNPIRQPFLLLADALHEISSKLANGLKRDIDTSLTLKGPIKTAADDKFCDIFPSFRQIRYDIT